MSGVDELVNRAILFTSNGISSSSGALGLPPSLFEQARAEAQDWRPQVTLRATERAIHAIFTTLSNTGAGPEQQRRVGQEES